MFKRLFDIFFALIGLLVFSPVALYLAIAIYREDGFPIFFTQQRLGRAKKPFTIYKFRTMKAQKVTQVGHQLRGKGLDEVSQFWNVLKGEMSVVGPRPLTLTDVERLGWDKTEYIKRWNVKPGITGLSQIYGGRHARTSWFLDKKYLKTQSLWLDFKLIVLSFIINIVGKQKVRQWRKK